MARPSASPVSHHALRVNRSFTINHDASRGANKMPMRISRGDSRENPDLASRVET
jgi:hypothetical protein